MANYKTIELDAKYVPKKSEKYMSDQQQAYFYHLLTAEKEELLAGSDEVLSAVRLADKVNAEGVGDDSDSSNLEQEIQLNLRISERNRGLLAKIDTALDRLDKGTYGYSVISNEEIGLQRMLARPLATMTVEEQEEYESKKK